MHTTQRFYVESKKEILLQDCFLFYEYDGF